MLGRQMVVQTVCGRGKGIFRDFPSEIKYKNCICSKRLLFSIIDQSHRLGYSSKGEQGESPRRGDGMHSTRNSQPCSLRGGGCGRIIVMELPLWP